MGNTNLDHFQRRQAQKRRLQALSYAGLGTLAAATAAVVWMALTR
ncbi:hypothetical protein ACHMXB_12245 [Arthrobacter sp. UC242_113]